MIEFIKENDLHRNYTIIADAANPEKIEEIRRAGIRIKPARRGKGAIRKGIDTVKQYRIKVYSDELYNSSNIVSELHKYKWREDKNGEPMEEPIDKFNHALDAARYGAFYLHRKRSKFKIL